MKGIQSPSIPEIIDNINQDLESLRSLTLCAKGRPAIAQSTDRKDIALRGQIGMLVCAALWNLGEYRSTLERRLCGMGFFQRRSVKKFLRGVCPPDMDHILTEARTVLVPWMMPSR